jgi:hypothetical protein
VRAKFIFISVVMTMDSFFFGYAAGFNSRHVLIVDPKLPRLIVHKPEAKKSKTPPPAPPLSKIKPPPPKNATAKSGKDAADGGTKDSSSKGAQTTSNKGAKDSSGKGSKNSASAHVSKTRKAAVPAKKEHHEASE